MLPTCARLLAHVLEYGQLTRDHIPKENRLTLPWKPSAIKTSSTWADLIGVRMLTGLLLYRSHAGSHGCCEFLGLMVVLSPERPVSHLSPPRPLSLTIFSSSLPPCSLNLGGRVGGGFVSSMAEHSVGTLDMGHLCTSLLTGVHCARTPRTALICACRDTNLEGSSIQCPFIKVTAIGLLHGP